MCRPPASRLILDPTLLGRDGLLRAYTLVATDRPEMTLDEWLADAGPDVPRRDRPLGDGCGADTPPRGLVGLTAPTGCLFAVFAYGVEVTPAGSAALTVRGPSCSAPMGGRMVPDGVESTIDRLAAELGCAEVRRRPW